MGISFSMISNLQIKSKIPNPSKSNTASNEIKSNQLLFGRQRVK